VKTQEKNTENAESFEIAKKCKNEKSPALGSYTKQSPSQSIKEIYI